MKGVTPFIEAPYFCVTKNEALKKYEKWIKDFPNDAKRLYIAKIIKKPKEG